MNTTIPNNEKDCFAMINNFLGEYGNNQAKSVKKVIRPLHIMSFDEYTSRTASPGYYEEYIDFEFKRTCGATNLSMWSSIKPLQIRVNDVDYSFLPTDFGSATNWREVFTYGCPGAYLVYLHDLNPSYPNSKDYLLFSSNPACDGSAPYYLKIYIKNCSDTNFQGIKLPYCGECGYVQSYNLIGGSSGGGGFMLKNLYLGSLHYNSNFYSDSNAQLLSVNADLLTDRFSASLYNFKEGLFSILWQSASYSGFIMDEIVGTTALFTGYEITLNPYSSMVSTYPPNPAPPTPPILGCS